MRTLEQDQLWYANQYEHLQGGYTKQSWSAKAAVDLSRKYGADPRAIFDAVYAAITSKG